MYEGHSLLSNFGLQDAVVGVLVRLIDRHTQVSGSRAVPDDALVLGDVRLGRLRWVVVHRETGHPRHEHGGRAPQRELYLRQTMS